MERNIPQEIRKRIDGSVWYDLSALCAGTATALGILGKLETVATITAGVAGASAAVVNPAVLPTYVLLKEIDILPSPGELVLEAGSVLSQYAGDAENRRMQKTIGEIAEQCEFREVPTRKGHWSIYSTEESFCAVYHDEKKKPTTMVTGEKSESLEEVLDILTKKTLEPRSNVLTGPMDKLNAESGREHGFIQYTKVVGLAGAATLGDVIYSYATDQTSLLGHGVHTLNNLSQQLGSHVSEELLAYGAVWGISISAMLMTNAYVAKKFQKFSELLGEARDERITKSLPKDAMTYRYGKSAMDEIKRQSGLVAKLKGTYSSVADTIGGAANTVGSGIGSGVTAIGDGVSYVGSGISTGASKSASAVSRGVGSAKKKVIGLFSKNDSSE